MQTLVAGFNQSLIDVLLIGVFQRVEKTQVNSVRSSTQKHQRRRATRPSNHHHHHQPGAHDIGMHTDVSEVQCIHRDPVSESDPAIKYALWHEGDPFVLERRTNRIKKCRGCRKEFVNENFVVRHEEKAYFVKKTFEETLLLKRHITVVCVASVDVTPTSISINSS